MWWCAVKKLLTHSLTQCFSTGVSRFQSQLHPRVLPDRYWPRKNWNVRSHPGLVHWDICCVPLGSETRIYEFPSRKYRSIEVGNVVFPSGKLGILQAPPTSDSEIRVGKYEFPSPVERSNKLCVALYKSTDMWSIAWGSVSSQNCSKSFRFKENVRKRCNNNWWKCVHCVGVV